jgi:hypothetical protein
MLNALLVRLRAMSAAKRKLFAALGCYAVLLGLALYTFLPVYTYDEQLILGMVLLVFATLIAKTLVHHNSRE